MHYASDFLTKNIITYLGNKRTLLEFINNSVDEVVSTDPNLSKKNKKDITVFDIFSGSGIVARSLKQFGYKVYSNDLEVYTKAINATFIETNEEDLPNIFKDVYSELLKFYKKSNIKHTESTTNDKYEQVINLLNSVRDLGEKQSNPYFSKYYSPKNTAKPNFDTERLFYTQENGRFIDAVLDAVFEFKKDDGTLIFSEKARNIILASLFNKMTTNINTSGTMKGFHNGWGGVGENALQRILADIKLERIKLLKNGVRGVNFNDYAENIFINNKNLTVDIIYADPPYNQHQYSANYHMLTTAMNNRDYKVSATLNKGERAGIRKDHNRSDFSKVKKTNNKFGGQIVSEAYIAFDKFIKNTMDKTKYIIISYNQEGVLSHEELIDILSQNGTNTVEIKVKKHDKFKGGKNTNLSNSVVEYLFIVKTRTPQSIKEQDKVKIITKINTKLTLLTDKYIDLKKVNTNKMFSVNAVKDSTQQDFIISFNNDEYFIVGNNYKIKSLNINTNSIDSIDAIESICYDDFDKSGLIKDYIEHKKILEAIDVLYSLKIEKYKAECLTFINILEKEQLTNKQQKALLKLKDHVSY